MTHDNARAMPQPVREPAVHDIALPTPRSPVPETAAHDIARPVREPAAHDIARPAPRPRAGWILGTIVAAAAAWAVGWIAGVSWAWRETTPSLTLPGAIVARMLWPPRARAVRPPAATSHPR
jgi:hypothetical protein